MRTAAARRPKPSPPREPARALLWGSVALVVIVVAAALALPARDAAALGEARRAWTEQGQRPPAPPATSGGTRELQERM
ncbi:MAG: hypothetical protein ACOZNI_33415 [Myxococcota bacterium]